MKKLFALLLPLLAAVGCLQEERSPEEILVPTPAQMDCSASSFLMTSQVPKGSENLIDDCGFYVGTDNTLSGAAKVKATLTDNNISADLPARDYGTTYYMCSFVTNGHGSEIRSDVRSFKLEELETYVEFGEVNLTSYDLGSQHTEITIDASILAGVEVDEIGVCYGEDKDNLSIEGDHKVGVLSGETRAAGFISIILDGLLDDVQYYLRPYIKDGSHLAYGDVIPFLIPAVPVVYTYDAQDITPQSATLCGKVLKGADISDRGFIYNEGTCGIEDLKYKVSVFGDIGEYTAQLNGLNPNKKYTYCAYTINPMGTYYGEVKSFTTNVDMPAVTSAVVSAITSTTAKFSSSVKSHGGETVTEVGFYYSTEPSVDPETALKVNQPYSQDAFSIDVEKLDVYTKYYVMAYATNSAGTTYSDVATFTTDSSYPTVQTVGATDINSQGATLSGSVLSDNGASITERGFVYMQGTGTPTTDSYKLKVSGKTGEYTGSLSGLEPNKKYSFRAYAVNSKGTAYGEVMSFLTVTGLPKVSAVDVSKIASTSATLTADVTDHGGETVSEVGFYYSQDAAVDVETAVKVVKNYAGAAFSESLSNLEIFTTYYVKAYAVNSAGVAYSTVVSFKTLADVPVVQTLGASEVSSEGATLSGTVVADNGATIKERGFVWMQGDGTPTTSNSKLQASGTIGDFTAALTGLEPNKKYSFRAYAVNSMGTSYGEVMSFLTVTGLPKVSAVDVSKIASTSATLTADVTDHGGETVSEVGFYYSTDPAVDVKTSVKVTRNYAGGAFSTSLTDLSVFTTYYVKAYAVNSAGVAYSSVVSFKTLADVPVVQTLGSAEVGSDGATLSGTVLTDNGASITERGFVWMQGDGTPTTSNSKLKASGTTGDFTAALTGLEPNKKYSFRAYAINSVGTAYGAVMTFSTSTSLPRLSLVNVSAITSTSATLTSNVADHGGETVSEVGFYYSTDPAVDINTSEKITKTYAGAAFTAALSDLAIYTTYYVKAYAVNSAGTAYSNVVNFRTLASTPVVKTVGTSEVTSSGAILSGSVVTDNGAEISERGFVWLQGDGTPTTESRKLTASGTVGDFEASLTGLEPNKKYSFRAYAINSMGTSYGDIMTFSTVAGLPVLSAVDVSKITATSATFAANVTDHGGETVSEVGFYYSTEETVDVSTAVKVSKTYTGTSFNSIVENLEICTSYYVKAYAVNSAGTVYSKVVSFKTLASSPVVRTLGSSNVSSTGATISGTVVTDNGAAITQRGFVWVQGDGTPTTSSHKLTVDGALGDFEVELTDLDPNKKYSFRAYAINSVGTSYGEVMNFSTVTGLPSVSSVDVSNISSTSATLAADVTNHGGETVSEVGFYYSTEESVDVSRATKVSKTYTGSAFTATLNDLKVATTYYVKAYAVNSAGTVYSKVVSFKTLASTPLVSTVGSSDVTENSAVLSGNVVADNGSAIKERGFVWLQGDGTLTTSSNRLKVSGTTGDFTATLTGLEPNKKYSFRAYAINSMGTSYGDVMSFSTVAGLPSVSSVDVSNIESTSATISANVTDQGGDTVTEVGFYYSTEESVPIEKSTKVTKTYTGSVFSASLSGLSIFTTYYVKAYAVNSAGTSYSNVVSFKTLASTPLVSTVGSSDVTENSAVLSGNVVADNGSAIKERGFVWLQGDGTPTTSSNRLKVSGTTGDFTATLTGLEPNKKYSFRAYAINSMGTSYGDVMTFSTVAGLPSVSSVDVSKITSTSATFASNVTYHGGETVTEVGFYYSTEETVDITKAVKVSKTYTGSSFTATLNDLSIATTYYVKAYAVNSAGTSYSAVASFKTLASTPVVNTVGSSSITSNSAVLSGKVVTDSGSPITQRGFVWLQGDGTPTTSSHKLTVDGALGDFAVELTDLDPNKKYSFRAYAINSLGTSYGDIMTFITVAGLPSLSVTKVTDLTTTTAMLSCTVTGHGGATVSEVGFYYSKSENVDVATAMKVSENYSTDNFSLRAENLEVGTYYYVRAYTKNHVGEVMNDIVSFKTVSDVPTVATTGSSEITANSALLSGDVQDDNGEPITECGFVWLKGTSNPTTSSKIIKMEGTLGQISSILPGLEPEQTYTFRAYAKNSKGTAYGEPMTFTTAKTPGTGEGFTGDEIEW